MGVLFGLVPGLEWLDAASRSMATCTSRRQMLRVLVAAAAVPFLPALLPRPAFADSNCTVEYPPADIDSCPGKKHHEGHTTTMNGCGPQAGPLSHITLDQSYGTAQFWPACDAHDCCYGRCSRSGTAKADCDQAFDATLRQSCQTAYPGSANDVNRLACLDKASQYVWAVTNLGGGAFDSSQAEDCECCQPKSVPKVYCNCTKLCYTDLQVCLASCRATLGCFTGICYGATADQCPPLPPYQQ